jgi:hypothetical protein
MRGRLGSDAADLDVEGPVLGGVERPRVQRDRFRDRDRRCHLAELAPG